MRWLLTAFLVFGCAANLPPEPKACSISLNRNLDFCRAMWQAEANRRFDHPFVFICHGADDCGKWTCYPDGLPPAPVETIASLLAQLYPDRQIILVCCNADGDVIHVNRTWYARKIVATVPDRFAPLRSTHEMSGSIFEFTQ